MCETTKKFSCQEDKELLEYYNTNKHKKSCFPTIPSNMFGELLYTDFTIFKFFIENNLIPMNYIYLINVIKNKNDDILHYILSHENDICYCYPRSTECKCSKIDKSSLEYSGHSILADSQKDLYGYIKYQSMDKPGIDPCYEAAKKGYY